MGRLDGITVSRDKKVLMIYNPKSWFHGEAIEYPEGYVAGLKAENEKRVHAETAVATITGRVIELRSTTAGHEFLNATKRWVKVRK